MWRHRSTRLAVLVAVLSSAAVGGWMSRDREPDASTLEPKVETSTAARAANAKSDVSDETRAALVARAHLCRHPAVPTSRASFGNLNLEEMTCRFKVSDLGGTSPKFDCLLETGEEVRIKYGNGPEVPAE